jgi:hypothetical protein
MTAMLVKIQTTMKHEEARSQGFVSVVSRLHICRLKEYNPHSGGSLSNTNRKIINLFIYNIYRTWRFFWEYSLKYLSTV